MAFRQIFDFLVNIARRRRRFRPPKGGLDRFKMGNEYSSPVSEYVLPVNLYARTIEAVADYVKKANVKRVVVMTGAGISTSAGIPDFRSPDTGLYANLARLNLPYAEAVFDISYFRNNPKPFYELAHELYPGKYRPTVTHAFISLLHKKDMLLKAFTQNIDCLEREAGVPGDAIVEAHGSFATQRCIECHTDYPEDKMRDTVARKEVPHCVRQKCGGLVKPDIVFFGEALPESFHRARGVPMQADLAIVMGTSLTVQPFASLPSLIPEGIPRILINMERVGGLGTRSDDVLILGDCDEGVRKLADALGWREELEALWEKTNPEAAKRKKQKARPKDKQTELDETIDALTKSVDATLKISQDHQKRFEEDFAKRPDTGKLDVPSSTSSVPTTAETKKQNDDKVSDLGSQTDSLQHVFPHMSKDSNDRPEKPSL